MFAANQSFAAMHFHARQLPQVGAGQREVHVTGPICYFAEDAHFRSSNQTLTDLLSAPLNGT
jgi:hypothetical protein